MQRKAVSMSLLARWNDPTMDDARSAYRRAQELRQPPGTMTDNEFVEFMKAPENSGTRFAVMDMGNLFEEIEQAIRFGAADPDMLAGSYVPLVRNSSKVYSPWLEYLRDNQPHIYGAYVPYHHLRDRWRELPDQPLA